ncbi:MAG: hypothetical protein CMQ49_03250 [Gammaproteobacteria bacterium]|nr:hypothetical protein [Gammaproteobacteria bacterium]|tara:strand:- start:2833 stop:3522 length:690 start_codon:yes stop_codon:yes gene_type:complete
MWLMLCAGVLFVGAHLGISSTGLRPTLVRKLGEKGYLGVYSLIALVTLWIHIWVYTEVPRQTYLWALDPNFYLLTKVLMPVALILAVGGFMVKNPTAVHMEATLADAAGRDASVRGVNRITRHPFQWGVVIWALTHMLANGDAVSVVFFASFAVLSAAGTVLMDKKKARSIGADWSWFAQATSNVPFAAIVRGRNRLVAKELVAPVAAGLLVYAALYWGHQWVSGVPIY